MDIRFVGSGDAFGTGGRFQTCIRLQADGFTALVDCGATSLTAMKAQALDPGEVDTVVISHLHADHFAELRSRTCTRVRGGFYRCHISVHKRCNQPCSY